MRYFFIIFLLLLSSISFASFLEGPFIGNVREDSVVIWWNSDPPIGGRLFLDGRIFEDNKPPFEIHIKGLMPSTLYRYYVVFSNGRRSPKKGYYRFYTASKKEEPFRFAVLADSRGGSVMEIITLSIRPVNEEILSSILNDIKRRDVRFICFLGDLVYGYCDKEEKLREGLRVWKRIVSPIMHKVPVYIAMGNHDTVVHEVKKEGNVYVVDGAIKNGKIIYSENIISDEFVNPENFPNREEENAPSYRETAYSFDWGNSHFLFMNTSYWLAEIKEGKGWKIEEGNPEGRIMDKQMEWIEEDLRSARKRDIKNIFVFGHHPIFPISKRPEYISENLRKDMMERRKRLWDLFRRYKVKACFFGHEHNYSRTFINGIWQIITGGAGAPLKNGPRKDLKWRPEVFKKVYHYCIVTVKGDKVTLDVYGLVGGRFILIDHKDL